MPPVIARYQENYLGITERFIYDLATNLKHHTNLMLTWKIIDYERFPLDHLYTNDLPRYSFWWWYDRLSKYLLKRPQAYFEHILRKFDAKLIHAHFGPNGVQMLPLKRRVRIPLITSFHGYDYVGIPRLAGNPQMYTELFAEGEIFLVEGQYSKNLLISIGCPAEKIRIQRLGIVLDPLKFSHRKLMSSEETIVILYVGRFVEKKAPLDVLQVIERVRHKFPRILVKMIGDGPLRQEVEAYIEKTHLHRHVMLLGMQPYENMLAEMDQAHIFFLPSVTASNGDTEGGPAIATLYAEAKGLPVLSTYHADTPESMVAGKSAFLAQEHDLDGLAYYLEQLLSAPEIWPEMGEHGRRHVEENYDIKKTIAQLEQLYMSCY